MRKLYVIGTGGLAKETAQLVTHINATEGQNRWQLCGYIGPTTKINASMPYTNTVGDDNWLLGQTEDIDIVLAVGAPPLRKKIIERYSLRANFSFPNLIHPSVTIDEKYFSMGEGNVFTQGVIATCDIQVGSFNLFNLNVTLGHDDKIGSFNVVNPGSNLSGNVTLGDETLIGTGVQVLENIAIASRTIIGAGSLVTRSIDQEGGTYIGTPAKKSQ